MRLSKLVRESISHVQKLIKHDLNIVTADKYVINVKSGSGGQGLARYNGVGGNGGDVYFVAKPNLAFTDVRKRLKNKMKIRADNGESATKTVLIGNHAKNKFFDVPVGIEVVDQKKNVLIARCSKPFNRYLIARGGEGGHAKSAYKGAKGDQLEIEIHLKLRPNIGLLGFPNAGKSTLLKALVPEKSVKIAEYAFTTVNPQIAFYKSRSDADTDEIDRFASDFTLSIADLPGIIEGAAANRGRGHKFLKHLEYADVIVMVVDCGGFQLKNAVDCPFRTPLESIALLNRETELFNPRLARKPVICVLNKVDVLKEPAEKLNIKKLAESLRTQKWIDNLGDAEMRPRIPMRFEHVVEMSAKSGEIDEFRRVLTLMRHHLHTLKDVEDVEEKSIKTRLI